MEILGYLLTGTAAAAAVKLIDNLLQWHLNRKAKKEDKLEEKEEASGQRNEARIRSIEDKVIAIMDGQMYILLDRIRYLGCAYIKDECISFDDRRLLNQMHDVYHNGLGGNGDLDTLMEDVNDLPLK